MTFIPNSSFFLDIVAGKVPGHSAVLKFGRNPDVDTTEEDIWDGGGTWVPPTTARTHDIVSTSTNDDGSPAGTGAQTVEIFGLDASYNLQNETVTMNGTTNVPTANTYTMIHRMIVRSAGSLGKNDGVITATAQTDGTVTAQISNSVGQNQTLMAIYQIPAGYTGFLVSGYADMNRATTSGAVDVRLLVKPFGEVYQVKTYRAVQASGTSSWSVSGELGIKIEEKSIVKIAATASAVNTDVSAGFDIILIDNNYLP